MKNEHKILVTGVGALIGQGICKNLKKRKDVVVFGLDRRATISSLIFCDKFNQKPNYCEDDPRYLQAILDIVSSQKIDLIIPGISIDVIFFDRYKKNFEKLGCKVCVNSSELISLTNDKFLFYKFLKKSGFLTIPTTTSRNWDYVNEKLHYILNKDPNAKYVHYVEHSWLDKRKNGGLMNDGSLPHDEKQ